MIEFGIWAPSEAVFWASWQSAGICDAERNLLPPYEQCVQLSALDGWHGIVTRATGEVDEHGTPIMAAVPGWHCNVRVFGAVAEQFTSGIPQHDESGLLRDVMDRTWAPVAFALTEQPADLETGFPAGWRSASGVTYTDARNFSSPACVWQ